MPKDYNFNMLSGLRVENPEPKLPVVGPSEAAGDWIQTKEIIWRKS